MVKNKRIKKKSKPMKEISKGFEKFIKGREQNENSKDIFEKVIDKTIKRGQS